MPSAPFQGYPEFWREASHRLGQPGIARIHELGALAALANLCAQAVCATPVQAVVILAKAAEFRDQLRVASLAADLMLEAISGEGRDEERPSLERPRTGPSSGEGKPRGEKPVERPNPLRNQLRQGR